MKQAFFIFCDGGARGNPGPAAIGVVIKDGRGRKLAGFGKNIGRATNNVAEYQAVIEALEWLKKNYSITPASAEASASRQLLSYSITFFLDSKLVVNQLNGYFKIKDAKLRELIVKVRILERTVDGKIYYRLIPREKNRQADLLVNQVLDQKTGKLS